MSGVARWLGGLLPGAGTRRTQVTRFAAEWAAHNAAALLEDGPLWVAAGDSATQGIGASAMREGYVPRLLALIRRHWNPAWRVVNLSLTGARVRDTLDLQLPRLEELAPQMVTCAIGANDLLRPSVSRLHTELRQLCRRLPVGSYVANLPQGIRHRRAVTANMVLADAASQAGLHVVDLWSHTGPPWHGKFSADHFHPNDSGYGDWVAAFAQALALPAEQGQ